jgi:hypothetical protein
LLPCQLSAIAPRSANGKDSAKGDLAEGFFQPPYRRKTPIGGTLLYKKQLGVFSQSFNILRKKGENNFKIAGIGQAFGFIPHRLKVRNSINEKGSYD